jgi:hypothetical protein
MRSNKIILALGLLILGATATTSAMAHHRWHGRIGVFIGGPAWYPAPYYYPPYYAPYPYYAPAPVDAGPPEYIERGDSGAPPYAERAEAAPPARQRGEGSWYFCPESNAYYPYVKQCPGGWQRVAPRPPAGAGAER